MIVTLSEALASLRAAIGRSTLIAIALALCIGAPTALEAVMAARAADTYQAAIADGSEVLVVQSSTNRGLDAVSCEQLGRSESVVAAGSMTPATTGRFVAAPGITFLRAHVSPGYLAVVAPGQVAQTTTHISLGLALANDLGLTNGSTVQLQNQTQTASTAVVDPRKRAPEQARWLLEQTTMTRAQQCWVEAEPGARSAVAESLRATFAPLDPNIKVTALQGHDAISTLSAWNTRPTAWAWLVGAAAGIVLVALTWIPRRGELALRRAIGFSRSKVALQIATELVLILIVAVVIAAAWSALICRHADAANLTGIIVGARTLAFTVGSIVALTPALAMGLTAGNLTQGLRSR